MFEQLWNSINLYGCPGPGINRRWVLWATRHISNFMRLSNSFEAIWIYMVVWARKQIEDGRCELSASPINSYVVWTPLTQYEFMCLLGAEIYQTRVLWAIRHSINLYCFWAGLKQCEFIWVFGAQKWIEDGSCQLSHTLQICTACERLRNNMSSYVLLGSDINRRWVLWANRHPINSYAFWTALKQYELICLFGPGI